MVVDYRKNPAPPAPSYPPLTPWAPSSPRTSSGSWTSAPSPEKHSRGCISCSSSTYQSQWWCTSTPPSLSPSSPPTKTSHHECSFFSSAVGLINMAGTPTNTESYVTFPTPYINVTPFGFYLAHCKYSLNLIVWTFKTGQLFYLKNSEVVHSIF